jgi:8-oxo-dGTP pyrophosphatase MutT (NUDIX family)
MNQQSKNIKKDLVCINCGYCGHTSKNCNFPITSFGVVTYKVINNRLYYLMIQRKDSLCYTEFIRGKYDLKNIKYVSNLLTNMTRVERTKLQEKEFDFLWKEMWVNNTNNLKKEYNTSQLKFNKLKSGYFIKSSGKVIHISLELLLHELPYLQETEWEFPKGRRKLNEKDIHCALREFEEETNINRKLIFIEDTTKQYEEIFIGKNKLRYRNIFYIASYLKNNVFDIFFDNQNLDQIKEIADVMFMTYEQVLDKIKAKPEKLELFIRIHTYLSKTKNII